MLGEIIKGLISPVTSIANKMVMDKDKYAELQFKKLELTNQRELKLLEITTTPRIDAAVKLLIAIRDVVIPLLRPVGSAAMTAFGIYMHYKGTPMDTGLQMIFDGAFPAWGTSRHLNKQTEAKKKESDWPDV